MLCVWACIVICLLSASTMALEGTETVSTTFESLADPAEGNQYRKDVMNAWQLIHEGHYSKAFSVADEVISQFEGIFDHTARQFAFKSDVEFEEFIARDDKPAQRIDWSYIEALQIKAYIYSSNRYFEMALAELETIDHIAPISAATKIEKAYILGQLNELSSAYDTYRGALKLADRFSSQSIYKAAALRGIGFILIEMDKLEEAEEALQKSLIIEPDNDVALNELAYIQQLRGL
ncbi:tetratricopeptide repeat protein [Hahella ganghwensis]|uniref:tetratricopeptide repeat protein n=1 Tax=Hahella ganghwensis TaxID=286420 RepID=UPI000365975C|nr:tetratricopeptide repeat protein [Hahella ganghwensis]